MNRRIETALRLMAALGAVAAPALAALVASSQAARAEGLPAPAYAVAAPELRPTLPAPAYAQRQATNGGAQTYDRYGGGTPHPRLRTAMAAYPASSGYTGPRLSWSGKAEAAAPAPRPWAGAATVQPAPMPAPSPPPGWAYVAPALPTSIYDAPAPAPAQQTASPPPSPARAAASTARRYSVAREFGAEPDPIPLPPQFFGATADLTQPETADPLRRTAGANGKARNAIQPGDGQ